jgi:hypothetical protein
MKKAALGLVAIALASATLAVPLLQGRSLDRRSAGEWGSAVAGFLAANAYGYGPGYNFSPGYAFGRGPDFAALAMLLRSPAKSLPESAPNDTVIADAHGLEQRAQPDAF